jgi:MFS family permease
VTEMATPPAAANVLSGRPAGKDIASIETRASWVAALAALGIMSVTLGAPFVAIVGLKPIVAELGTTRSVVSLAASFSWLGAAFGGVAMGVVAERFGARQTVIVGAIMIAVGLVLAASGGAATLLVGHGVFIGLLGNGAINAPLYVYVSRWFDRRLGSAIALISSGAYAAGVIWPEIFQYTISWFGWRETMWFFAALECVVVVPAALLLLRSPPIAAAIRPAAARTVGRLVFGLPSGRITALLLAASFSCCVTMSMPQTHLVALCGDLGIAPASGAAMLSLLLASAFLSRQFWGWVADHIGGLRTALAASACQAMAVTAFLFTQSEAGLFAVSAAFGLGFSGIVPSYIVAIGEMFPPYQAAVRVPMQLLFSGMGMAFGSWSAGALYDQLGFYAPAFALGLAFNLANLGFLSTLVLLQRRSHPDRPPARV